MRIIAGEFRGRKLLPPEGADVTRPITDRVKQSLFDILAPVVPGARVYDCFAGTGSLGLECLSRGAASVAFFESDRSAVGRLQRNIQMLGVQKSAVVMGDVFQILRMADAGARTDAPSSPADRRRDVSLIFLDPPYRMLRERPDRLRDLAGRFARTLTPDGTLVFRHDARDKLDLPHLVVADERTYGGMTLEFLRPGAGDAPNEQTP
jgi:16S rRNA (guanine(966)-N(2))-methyltransferase RsmD